MSFFVRYWSTDPERTMLGLVMRSESSRYSHREDAEGRLTTIIDVHATVNPPLRVAGEIVESDRPAEIVRHCQTPQVVGFICPDCKQRIPDPDNVFRKRNRK